MESKTVTVLCCRIERLVSPHSFRGTRSAVLQGEDGWFYCEVFFENKEPRIQVRSLARGLEEAAKIGVALQLASEWAVEEMQRPDFYIEPDKRFMEDGYK